MYKRSGVPHSEEVASALAWSARNALHGAILGLPAGVAMLSDPNVALALAVGVLPAAALGVSNSRRQRTAGLLVGGIAAASLFVGSVIAGTPVLAVCTILVLCIVVAQLSAGRSSRLSRPVLVLGLPLIGAGLSLSTVSAGLAAAGLVVLGSVFAFCVSLAWPDRPAASPARAMPRGAPRPAMLVYGIQIGLAGAIGAATGFALGVDHPGWACAAALLVSRPEHSALVARGWGRALSVIAGALLSCGVAVLDPAPVVLAVLVVAVLTVGTALAGSRWYVFPFFSTFLVISMLLLDDDTTAAHWFVERVGLTLLGVALALAAALVVPRLARPLLARRAG